MSAIKHGIAWNKGYEIGDEEVDLQHRTMFEKLSELVEACIDGSSKEKLGDMLGFLATYAVKHFEDEEAYQLKHKYPGYQQHKEVHEKFKVTVGELVERFNESGSSEQLSSDVNKIVVKWLIEHILGEDKKIGAYVKQMHASA